MWSLYDRRAVSFIFNFTFERAMDCRVADLNIYKDSLIKYFFLEYDKKSHMKYLYKKKTLIGLCFNSLARNLTEN